MAKTTPSARPASSVAAAKAAAGATTNCIANRPRKGPDPALATTACNPEFQAEPPGEAAADRHGNERRHRSEPAEARRDDRGAHYRADDGNRGAGPPEPGQSQHSGQSERRNRRQDVADGDRFDDARLGTGLMLPDSSP